MIKIPTKTKTGKFVIIDRVLEFKRMSDVTDQYITRAKRVAEVQYASITSALDKTLRPQGWLVKQVSFIAGALTKRTGLTTESRIL